MAYYGILLIAWLYPAIALIGATTAAAAQTQTVFQVTSSIPGSCTVTAVELDFGAYDGSQSDMNGNITVACTKGASYQIGLDNGLHYSAPNRRLKHGATANYLIYELYRDVGRTLRWGNDDAGSVFMTGDGMARQITVYGRVPAGQSGLAGSYSNVTVVTVNF
jgi:spore coat protein U-like protein